MGMWHPIFSNTFQQLTSKQKQFQRHLSIVEIIVVVLEMFQKVNGNFVKQTEASFLLHDLEMPLGHKDLFFQVSHEF